MRITALFIVLVLLAGCIREADHATTGDYITDSGTENTFPFYTPGRMAAIHVSAGDHPGVLRAAGDLQADLERVTGTRPALHKDQGDPGDALPEGETIMIAGTLGMNPVIDRLVEQGTIDVSAIEGKWEASVTTVLKDPLPGIGNALVIAGSDKRGTIFGIYELSAQIGVSPWYFWADVVPEHRDEIHAIPGTYLIDEPAVKYRGIFINDEAPALAGWVHENFGSFNHEFYAHVYELILRMKGNYLWPAMWGRALYDDDSLNAPLAHEYGIVIGTTHHEPMMRAHVEWARYGNGPWDYTKNADTLQAFWKRGLERMGSHESIVSLGMRGDGDEPMTEGTAIALLEDIVATQRRIIGSVTGKDPAETPQLWALYKEVQEYYDRGMRVPEDVTLLLCDDNWGNIRKLPQPGEPERQGGYGIYYHFDYVGGPRNYKWLNTTQIERVWEQMHLAHQFGANQIWIVNVGDIKPMELPIQFFLEMAWDPGRIGPDDLPGYYETWAAQQFGKRFAEPVAEILAGYTKINSRRKPELLSPGTYSLSHFREAEQVLKGYKELEELATFIYGDIPPALKDAYYQLVLFPVRACANLHELYVATALNHLYAAQGRSATNQVARLAGDLYRQDSLLTLYYHREMAGGKWNHMMSQTHIGYTYWQQPERNSMPQVQELTIPGESIMGISIENSTASWPGSDQEPVLPVFDPMNRQDYYVEIFNRGSQPFTSSISPSVPWIVAPSGSFQVELQERIYLEVDWDMVPVGFHRMPVVITGPENSSVTVFLEADNRSTCSGIPDRELFVENNGVVSIEAAHFQRKRDGNGISWTEVPNLGRTDASMITLPVTAGPSVPGGNAPVLEYDICFRDSGTYVVTAFLSPTLNYHNNEGLRFAVSMDEDAPLTLNMHREQGLDLWNTWVAGNINRQSAEIQIPGPGVHTLKYWRIDAGVVLQKITIMEKGITDPSYLGAPESLRINQEPPSPG